MDNDGKYYDGVRPVSIAVRCFVTVDSLVIMNADSEERLATWDRKNIYKDPIHNTAVVLAHKLDRSKIELSNLEIVEKLGFDSGLIVGPNKKILGVWAAVLVLVLVLMWFAFPIVTKHIALNIPYEYERKMAKQFELPKSLKACSMTTEQANALNAYVTYLYPKNSLEKNMPIEVHMVNSEMINAFTLPGGKILLMKGLVNDAKTPDELLGVLGHEIGHVINRDIANFLVRSTLSTSLIGFMTGDFSGTFGVSPELFLSTVILSYDRDMELAADAYAAKRLESLNVSTSGMKAFFSRMNTESENDGTFRIPEFVKTHPNFDVRMGKIKDNYPRAPLPAVILDNWKTLKTICD